MNESGQRGAHEPCAEEAHTAEAADGCRLRCWLGGRTGRPTVVLTHGAGADHRMFDPQIPAVVEAGYRTVRWDVRCHGESAAGPGPFRVGRAAEDLRAVLDAAGARRPVVLLGQSMGGNVSQEYLRRWPEEVSAIVVVGSTSNTLPLTRGESYRLTLSRPLMRTIPYRRLARWMAQASAVEPGAREYLHRTFLDTGRNGFLQVWDGMTRTVTPLSDYRIDKPQLLICGARDGTGNIRTAMESWSRRDPRSEFHVIPDAGHVANLDRADEVNQLIVGFLNAEVPPDNE